jgi:hypothetical protein
MRRGENRECLVMSAQAYASLANRLLDQELTEAQADQLSELIRADSRRANDLRRKLVLWELFEQQNNPERSAEAFLNSFRTRVLAERDAEHFVASTTERVRREGQPTESVSGPSILQGIAQLFSRLWAFRSRWKIILAASTALGLCLYAGLCFSRPMGSPTLMSGSLTLERPGVKNFVAISGTPLLAGDLLKNESDRSAVIVFAPEATVMALGPDSTLRIVSLDGGKSFHLNVGVVEASVAPQRPFQPMRLETGSAEARVLGTKFVLRAEPAFARLDVSEGRVRLTRLLDSSQLTVSAGEHATVATNYNFAVLPQTGGLLYEYWTNGVTDFLAQISSEPDSEFAKHPDGQGYVDGSESSRPRLPVFAGERLRGYLIPPQTGEYQFAITAGEEGYLYLSPDDRPEHRVHIVYDYNRALNAVGGPGSGFAAPLSLQGGKKYYLEVVNETAPDKTPLAVRWKRRGHAEETIPGEFLAPVLKQSR